MVCSLLHQGSDSSQIHVFPRVIKVHPPWMLSMTFENCPLVTELKFKMSQNGQFLYSQFQLCHKRAGWYQMLIHTLKKKWSQNGHQNGSTLEPFWKTAPLFKSGAIFSLIIIFEKKQTVPLTKVVPFAKTVPQ